MISSYLFYYLLNENISMPIHYLSSLTIMIKWGSLKNLPDIYEIENRNISIKIKDQWIRKLLNLIPCSFYHSVLLRIFIHFSLNWYFIDHSCFLGKYFSVKYKKTSLKFHFLLRLELFLSIFEKLSLSNVPNVILNLY